MVVNLVWMGRLFGFVFAYVYHLTITRITSKSYPSQEPIYQKCGCSQVRYLVEGRDNSDLRSLLSSERTDLLKGGLILLTCFCMSLFDASRVYHAIRGQSSIKLYVLFNVLDVFPLS
jgi:Eukaryotic membrane protein family